MKIIDIVLLIPLLFGAYKGYNKGLIMELAQIAALILGIVLGLKLIHVGVDYLKPVLGSDWDGWLPVLSFAIIFILTLFLTNWVGKILSKTAKAILLGWLDRLLGAIISMLKWAVAISFILWAGREVNLYPKGKTLIYDKLILIGPRIVEGIGYIIPYAKDIFEHIKNV